MRPCWGKPFLPCSNSNHLLLFAMYRTYCMHCGTVRSMLATLEQNHSSSVLLLPLHLLFTSAHGRLRSWLCVCVCCLSIANQSRTTRPS